jgi:hypothetical protein
MSLTSRYSSVTAGRAVLVALVWFVVFGTMSTQGQQVKLSQQTDSFHPSAADRQRIFSRAREILVGAQVSDAERDVRLQVLTAVLMGTVIRPDDDYPEMRNPQHWTLSGDVFAVARASTPVEAIADLWIAHENDGVPIPRIRCYKYSSLVLIEGYIQYFRHTGNREGINALNRLIDHKIIPQELPNGGDDLLWTRRKGSGRLLPGDQVWFDNPFFDHGRELIRQEAYEEAVREGKSPVVAADSANTFTEALTAGEEGSNVFCLGDEMFSRGAASLTRVWRTFLRDARGTATAHELVLTPKILALPHFQQHMIDDNYTAQACMRDNPATVRPEDFKIESVRSPIDPKHLLRFEGDSATGGRANVVSDSHHSDPPLARNLLPRVSGTVVEQPRNIPFQELIGAMASRNGPPRLVKVGDATIPLFGDEYRWAEQRRVRTAIDAMMRTKTDDSWWQLRASSGDDRYVLTATRGGVAKNFTVGEICSDLADLRLCLGFTAHLPSVPGRLPANFCPEQEYWRQENQWVRERTPLYLMQAALCARAIEQWGEIPSTLPGCDGLTHIYSAAEKTHFVAAMKREIEERNTTKKARYEAVVLPWLPTPSGWEGFDADRANEARAEYEREIARAK